MTEQSVLQAKLQDLTQKFGNLTKRKNDMQAELAQITTGLEARDQAIQKAMLDGKDPSKDLDAKRADKAKAESLAGAIAQADALLFETATEREVAERRIGMIEVLAARDDFETQMLNAIEHLKNSIGTFETLSQKLEDYRKFGNARGLDIESTPDIQTYRVFVALRHIFIEGQGIDYMLANIEDGYKNYLKEARERKPA